MAIISPSGEVRKQQQSSNNMTNIGRKVPKELTQRVARHDELTAGGDVKKA
jgi:hypothetical protein